MNFQFSGSIPNVHWHSNSNTMSSQSVTEFTILNGRVTVTRAANDTRNDVNVTIVANGRRNENPRRNCLCHREIRWRNRRRQGLHSLLRSVHDLKDNIYDATDDLSIARRKLQDLKDELQKVKDEVFKGKNKLKEAMVELSKAVTDLQVPQLYSLNEDEANVLRFDLNLAESEIDEARRHIREAEDDLNSVRQDHSAESNELEIEGNRTYSTQYFSSSSNGDAFTHQTSQNSMGVKNKCSVCLENNVNSVLYKCGHMCMCYVCALKLLLQHESKKCPVCRSEITDVIRTYLS